MSSFGSVVISVNISSINSVSISILFTERLATLQLKCMVIYKAFDLNMIVRGMPLTWLIVSVCVCRGSVCVFMHVRSST